MSAGGGPLDIDPGFRDLVGTIVRILNSNPDELTRFATRWSKVNAAALAQKNLLLTYLTNVEGKSDGAMAKQMSTYRLQMINGLDGLATATDAVSKGLQACAPQLASLRKELEAVLFGVAAAVASLAIPAVGEALAAVISAGDAVAVLNLVNQYDVTMATLNTALTSAGAQLTALTELQANLGGVLPDAPAVSPNG